MSEERDPQSIEARLDGAMKQLRLARERAREEDAAPDLQECITDALAATDAALAIERGESDVLLP